MNVKLYGTLSCNFAGYNYEKGVDVIVPDGSSVYELFSHLSLSTLRIGMIFVDEVQVDMDTQLADGARVKIFQPIFGG